MSFEGKFTPLQLNALGSLSKNTGFYRNRTMLASFGEWKPEGYTQGTITSTTVLSDLTTALSILKTRIGSGISATTFRGLLTLGNGVCPALGNSRPSTFKPSYAGYGSWDGGVMKRASYPPKGDYDVTTAKWMDGSKSYSYIAQNTIDGDNPIGKYGWLTGWGENQSSNQWQKYNYAVENTTEYDEYFGNGFLATIPRQAYYEMWEGSFSQYNNIVNSFTQAASYRDTKNNIIGSYVNSKTFMSGTYSNINDITTSNISGISLAFKDFGNDLISTGRAIDLRNIDKFGLPSVLLKTLQDNKVLTDSVKIRLLEQELSVGEINDILNNTVTPTSSQEKKIYDAMVNVTGDDLSSTERGILYGLNCSTAGITTLADLLDVKKLFPVSHNTITIPRYNIDPSVSASAKIYDFIYINGGVNTRIDNWGTYLDGILPSDNALACGAFSMTLQQVNSISSMLIEKLAQVITNMELTNLNLPLLNSTIGMSVDGTLVKMILDNTAMGSGNSGSYRMCDLMGAASGYPYNNIGAFITGMLNRINTTTLKTRYTELKNIASTIDDATLVAKITAINNEIKNIYDANKNLCTQLNYFWDQLGTQMFIEQRAIPMCFPDPSDLVNRFSNEDIVNFVKQLEHHMLDNGDGQSAPVLKGISDINTQGGQTIIAVGREARNASRLGIIGGSLTNNIKSYIDTCGASASATVVSGAITQVKVTNSSSGYSSANLPKILVYPVTVAIQAVLTPTISLDGSITSIQVKVPGRGYFKESVEIVIDPPPQCLPANEPQQTYADSPYKQIIEPALTATASSSPDVATAIADVTTCNCDCWT
jgi:hypothetical protein